MVGTASGFKQSEVFGEGTGYGVEYIRGKFADMIAMNISSMLARVITENKLNLLTIDAMKTDVSRLLGNVVNKGLMEFGLRIPEGQFYVTDIVTPDDDPNYIRMKEQYASSLDLKDMEIAKAKLVAGGEVAMTYKQVEAKLDLFDAQTSADIAKVSAQGFSDSAKIMATGSADSVVIEAKGEAEKIKLEGHAIVDVYKAQATAEADMLKQKGGDYKLETERIVDAAIAQNGVAFVNINIKDSQRWNCSACGKTGITSNFCPDCGAKRQ